MIYKALDLYYEKFGEVFPSMEYDMPIDEMENFMLKCIRLGKKAEELKPSRKDVIY